jgi:uncharacterized glyoxalase superfamily protein PhnB
MAAGAPREAPSLTGRRRERFVQHASTSPAIASEAAMQITPVLYVEEIEPVLHFWEERLGFRREAEVPEGDRLGFLILARDGAQVMYQTRESVQSDMPELADTPMGGTLLFITVDDLDDVARRLEGIQPVVPRRQTFYGADELIVREPAGNVVTFAEFPDEAA